MEYLSYSCKFEDGRYIIYEDDQILKTPAGNNVSTSYKPLADRILLDLEDRSMDYYSASSILAWHFTMIDHFSRMSHDRVEQILASSFLTRVDWTCRERYGAGWTRIFGTWRDRREYIEQWLAKATHMQMTAACCIGNAYESLNIAFALACILEKYDGAAREERLREVAQLLTASGQFGYFSDIYPVFKNFELYYGIHLEENGAILTDIVPDIGILDGEDELDVDNLSEYTVTIEQLVGRNYYHYTDCKRDAPQPAVYPVGDLELDESEDVETDYDEDFEDGENESLDDYLPDNCWVKRFVDDDDLNTRYLLYLVVDEDGKIEDSGCIEEVTQQLGGGGFFFMLPGIETDGAKSYEYNSCPPEKVINDLRLLFGKRFIPPSFSFIGKRLPQKMIDVDGNGGNNTEYTYALQSAHRLAYTHMSVETDEDGIIEGFSYSSYQSSGDGYGDMFTRPIPYADRQDEAMDMLLYLYDMYTNNEIKA